MSTTKEAAGFRRRVNLEPESVAKLRKAGFIHVWSQFMEHWLEPPTIGTPLSDEAQFVFTNGQCHAFAIAIHKLTGWQIVADDDFLGRAKGHILVRTPKGLIDATPEIQEYKLDCYQEVTPKDLIRAYKNGYRDWIYPNVRAALPFAKARLAQERELALSHESAIRRRCRYC